MQITQKSTNEKKSPSNAFGSEVHNENVGAASTPSSNHSVMKQTAHSSNKFDMHIRAVLMVIYTHTHIF